jgi:hypothetical protein
MVSEGKGVTTIDALFPNARFLALKLSFSRLVGDETDRRASTTATVGACHLPSRDW